MATMPDHPSCHWMEKPQGDLCHMRNGKCNRATSNMHHKPSKNQSVELFFDLSRTA